MDKYVERALELRSSVSPHYNCAQSVLIPFAEAAGTDEELLRKLAANFGGGMKRGSVCGAVTGALMALGMLGKDDQDTLNRFYEDFKSRHSDFLDCAELLASNEIAGGQKKPFCDGLVVECVKLVEELARD